MAELQWLILQAIMTTEQITSFRSRMKNKVKWMEEIHLNMVLRVGDMSLHKYEVKL